MNMLSKLLFGNSENISKRVYFWNLCSSMVYSFQSAILLLVVTRVGGLVEGGIFSIIYTVTQTLASLGSYSMRNYQVSDVKDDYNFETYYTSRIVTCVLMILSCMGYAIYKGVSMDRFLIYMLFSVYRTVDGFEDVYHGAVQKKGRLDVVSIAMTFRITLSMIMFSLLYVITHNLLVASVGMVITAVVLLLGFNKIIFSEFTEIKRGIDFSKVLKLLTVCFPIFLGAILYNYLVNVPKYSIDNNLGEATQTIFNILFMPVFVVNILSMFIFKPMVNQMGIWWKDGEIKKLLFSVIKQILIISGLTILVIIAGYFLGCPVLGIVFGVDLSDYPLFFALLLSFGGIAALSTFLSVVLTIMRKQAFIILGYVLGYVINLFVTDRLVIKYKINGAGYAYGIIMGVVLIVFFVVTGINFVIRYNEVKDGRAVKEDIS